MEGLDDSAHPTETKCPFCLTVKYGRIDSMALLFGAAMAVLGVGAMIRRRFAK